LPFLATVGFDIGATDDGGVDGWVIAAVGAAAAAMREKATPRTFKAIATMKAVPVANE
jgi:hypothetical protein